VQTKPIQHIIQQNLANMGDKKVILFDLPSKGESHCWSLNPWKGMYLARSASSLSTSQPTDNHQSIARLALNYKGIPYETRWTEYPEIAPLFKSFGIAPNPAGSAPTPYAIPAVRMPDGRYVMDSAKIAEALEAQQPSPSLQLASPRVGRTQEAVQLTDKALTPVAKPRVPETVLNPGSAEYFRRTRSQRFGMPLEELARSELAGEAAWTGAAEGLARVRGVLAEDEAGPYVMGAVYAGAGSRRGSVRAVDEVR
jgi:glutathione S-transferase